MADISSLEKRTSRNVEIAGRRNAFGLSEGLGGIGGLDSASKRTTGQDVSAKTCLVKKALHNHCCRQFRQGQGFTKTKTRFAKLHPKKPEFSDHELTPPQDHSVVRPG